MKDFISTTVTTDLGQEDIFSWVFVYGTFMVFHALTVLV